MNIGIFTDTYYPQISGVDTSVRILANGLRKLGHKVFIFTTTDPQAKEKQPYVFRLPSVAFIFLRSRRVAYAYPPKLLAKMKNFNLDVIHTQTEFSIGIFGKITAELLHIPIVHTYHTMYEDYVHYIARGYLITPKMARAYSRIFCNRATVVTTPVQKSKDCLISYGVKRPIHVIPTGIDFEPFRNDSYSSEEIMAAKTEIGILDNVPVIITIGRVAKEKSIDVVIRAMPKVLEKFPNARYVSIGDGPCISELTMLAQTLNISDSVIFAGPRPWKDIGKYYQIGDVFVSASTSETQGIVYVESMASNIPVIAKRDKSVEDILKHGETGMFFDTAEELADCICNLLSNEQERKRLSTNAFNNIKHLSSDIFAKNMETLYQNVLENSPAHRHKTKKRPLFDFINSIKKRINKK